MNSIAFLAHGRTDGEDRLVEAEEPLAGLQLRCGGELPGMIAAPALLELVRKARSFGLRMARPVLLHDDRDQITAWVEIMPDDAGQGCTISVANWQANPLPAEDLAEASDRRADIDRHLAEVTARLDSNQNLLTVDGGGSDLVRFVDRLTRGLGRPWTDFVTIEGSSHHQPLHWRLLDGARVTIEGSARKWTATLVPMGGRVVGEAGFELLLVADEPPPEPTVQLVKGQLHSAAIGREIAPVLRQPISRIIANAETIRARLAGPLADEYSNYAADIAAAGEHLLALIEDLSDLEVVEAEDFSAAPDQIDLTDVARRAVGILGVRAQERSITIDLPDHDECAPAVGEFRRVLQVLLNLIGNAIRYSPEGSQVWVRIECGEGRSRITVADQGQGMSDDQQVKIFDKFERLGRTNDGGSGLGLYISRRLARAMHGDLIVDSAPGQGARFTLDLPTGG